MTLSLADTASIAEGICHIQKCRLSLKTTMILVQNLELLKKAVPSSDVERNRILNECGNPDPTNEKFKDFLDKWNSFVNDTRLDVDLTKISIRDLNIGEGDNENHIPPMIVAQLLPLIESE